MLVPVVDSYIWIYRPNEHCIDAAVTLLKIIEIAVDCIFPRNGIVQIAIMHHHLGLYKAVLGPLKLRQTVSGPIVADADEALSTPMRDVSQPVTMCRRGTG